MPSINSQIYPHSNSSVRVHSVDDELIVFDSRSKQLARMNQSSTMIWKLHEEDLSVDEIAQQLSQIYGMAKDEFIPDIIQALDAWQAMGLLGNDFIPLADEADDMLGYMQAVKLSSKYKKNLQQVKSYVLLDSEFNIFASNSEIKNILLPLISHFPKTSCNISHAIKIIKEENSFIILDDDKLVGRCNAANEIAPIVNGHVLAVSFLEVNCLSVFHAGVIYANDGVVMFSAGSGSGKSTLTAALMCSGKLLFTDEIAILTHNKKIRPAPGCIGLKEGSWKVMEQYCPSIFELTTHYRQDSKIVKYLPPLSLPTTNQLEKGEPVKAIVFPKYSIRHDTELVSISTADALVKLTDSGYYTNQSLSHESVASLIDWIKEIPAYELSINDLKEAVGLVGTLL